MITLTCAKCGDKFTVDNYRRGTAKYCSHTCHYGNKRPPGICKNCNNQFVRLNNSQSYCSPACRGAGTKGQKSSREVKDCANCSEPFSVWPYEVRAGRRFCSKSCADKNRDRGKTAEGIRIRRSAPYAAWRQTVFARDDYTCQICGERGGQLHADHIKQFATHPQLRLSVDNGRTLCAQCHRKTDSYGGRGRRLKTALALEA